MYKSKRGLATYHQKKKNSGKSDKTNEDSFTQSITRNSRPQMFYKIDVLKNFAKLTVKHLCRGLL